MPEWITQLGVGGIFAIVIIRIVLDFLVKKKNNPGNNQQLTIKITQMLERLDHISDVIDKVYEKILQR